MKNYKYLKLFFIIFPYFLIVLLIYFFLERFQILDKNGQIVYGREISKNDIGFEESHIFYVKDSIKKISSSNKNGIKIENIKNNYFSIRPEINTKIKINIFLKDSLKIEESTYFTSEKIVAVSDIEGNFNVFKNFLLNNKIIDNNLNWIFGKGHLVCNGDFFDRGKDVTSILWLIYKLENEAYRNGGKVHFIIGNHEEMNISGNVKYSNIKYIALANQLNIPYKELYGIDTEIGRWLRTKNVMIKINDIIFTHGGISSKFIERNYNIEEANNLVRKYIGNDSDYIKFINERAYFLFDRQGPMWYRGYFDNYKKTKKNEIDKILKHLRASKIIVGHSIVDKVKMIYNQRVIAIDVVEKNDPRNEDDDNYANFCYGLLIDKNKFYALKSDGINKELK